MLNIATCQHEIYQKIKIQLRNIKSIFAERCKLKCQIKPYQNFPGWTAKSSYYSKPHKI